MKIGSLILGLLVLAALLLWPQSLGGWTSYVTYNQGDIGSSLAIGDLAVMRRARAYQAGDLVATQTSDGPPIFGWVASEQEHGYWISFNPKGAPAYVAEQYVLGRLWFNLGDVGRGVTGSVLSYFGVQAATSR